MGRSRGWLGWMGLFACLTLTACSIVVYDHAPDATPCDGQRTSVDAEIDAASRLDFDSSQLAALQPIAARTDLTPREQVHLVHVLYRCMDFESSKMTLLQTLIENPSLTDPARCAILDGLNRHLSFDSSRTAILRQLNQHRPPRPTVEDGKMTAS